MIGDGDPTEHGWMDHARGLAYHHPPWGPGRSRRTPVRRKRSLWWARFWRLLDAG